MCDLNFKEWMTDLEHEPEPWAVICPQTQRVFRNAKLRELAKHEEKIISLSETANHYTASDHAVMMDLLEKALITGSTEHLVTTALLDDGSRARLRIPLAPFYCLACPRRCAVVTVFFELKLSPSACGSDAAPPAKQLRLPLQLAPLAAG
jgi:hypothetical protein